MPTQHADMEKLEAAAFRRLVEHLRLRDDVPNAELIAAAGFCRNCLADWIVEASTETSAPMTVEEARHFIYGEPYATFKARHMEITADQRQRMKASQAENDRVHHERHGDDLDSRLDASFPASDPPKANRIA